MDIFSAGVKFDNFFILHTQLDIEISWKNLNNSLMFQSAYDVKSEFFGNIMSDRILTE